MQLIFRFKIYTIMFRVVVGYFTLLVSLGLGLRDGKTKCVKFAVAFSSMNGNARLRNRRGV
jgi:hypothetical protein